MTKFLYKFVQQVPNVGVLQSLVLVMFFLLFCVGLYLVLRMPKNQVDQIRNIPFDDGENQELKDKQLKDQK